MHVVPLLLRDAFWEMIDFEIYFTNQPLYDQSGLPHTLNTLCDPRSPNYILPSAS